MESVIGDVNELKELNLEITRLSKELKQLRVNRTEVEDRIIDFLRRTDQPGVKYKNIAVVQQERKFHKRPGKKEKFLVGATVLKGYGIDNPDEVLSKLLDAMRGSQYVKNKLRLKEIEG